MSTPPGTDAPPCTDAQPCTAELGRLRCVRDQGHRHGHVFDAGDVLDGRHDDAADAA